MRLKRRLMTGIIIMEVTTVTVTKVGKEASCSHQMLSLLWVIILTTTASSSITILRRLT